MTDIMVCLNSIQQFNTIHFRHHDITNHYIGHFSQNFFQSDSSVRSLQYTIFFLKDMNNEVTQLIIIFYNQYRYILLIFQFFGHLNFGRNIPAAVIQYKLYILVIAISLSPQRQ